MAYSSHVHRLSVKELNDVLRSLPENEAFKVKQRRRTLKNRGYAQNSRVKKVKQRERLEKDKDALEQELDETKKENMRLKNERTELKKKYAALLKIINKEGNSSNADLASLEKTRSGGDASTTTALTITTPTVSKNIEISTKNPRSVEIPVIDGQPVQLILKMENSNAHSKGSTAVVSSSSGQENNIDHSASSRGKGE